MLTDWNQIEEPLSSAEQRRSLYRLGLSRPFVHKHVKTSRQASDMIARLLEDHARLRGARHVVEEEPVSR